MSNLISPTVIKIVDVFAAMKNATNIFKQRTVLHLVSVFILVLAFIVMTFGMFLLRNNGILLIIAMIFTSFVLPMIFALLTVTKDITEQNLRKINYFKYISTKLWSSNTLPLIFIYLLILVALVLGLNLLLMNIESETVSTAITVTFKVVFIFCQFISFVAIPSNILVSGKIKPFHLLFATFKVVVRNFIPCLLFFVVNVIIVMLVLQLTRFLASFQPWVIFLDLPILLVIITWFGISCVFLAEQLFALKSE